jgi:hypothetical protein
MHGEEAVLVRATVVSMVPAAPLLPTTAPFRLAVVHRVVPATVEDVDVGTVAAEVVVDEGPAAVVDVAAG